MITVSLSLSLSLSLCKERLDTSVFPLLLILLHDEDPSVAMSCLRSMALTAAAYPPPPPATADGSAPQSNSGHHCP